MLLSFFLAILGIILIIRGRQSLLFHSVRWTEGVHALGIIGCCVFATLALERLGYRATIAIALGFLFGILERLKWWLVLSLALSLSFGSFWIFATVLKIMLPRGGWGF